ncbi:hypothetical protein [Kribbella capetownensis]|uniref:hypothetical protein n=1 Tax=Kribbella capetownensis TaxID=1572659 RepID=UPI0013F3C385|nr:hypothetical protein [Kribbella capetownensis]
MNHTRTAISVAALAVSATALGASHASAQYEPGPGSAPATISPDCHWAYHPVCGEDPICPEINHPEYQVDVPTWPADRVQVDPDWPDEGSGYPGYGDESSSRTAPDEGPPNYPANSLPD